MLQALLVGLAAGVLAFAVHGLLDAVTLGAKPVAGLFAMLGLGAAARRLVEIEHPGQGNLASVEAGQRGRGRVTLRGMMRSTALVSILAAAALLAWLVRPGLAERNAGLVLGHKVVMDARGGGDVPADALGRAEGMLQRAVSREDGSVHTIGLLGSLRAWRGDSAGAIVDLQERVALDGPDALRRYAPWVVWQRRLEGSSQVAGWADTVWFYSYWMRRYPDRAELYALVACAWEQWLDAPDRARAALESGLEKGAEPTGLLTTYLGRLE